MTYLTKPWLPPSEYGDKITLHHLASHLSRWLEALSDELVRVRPWLCVYHAWARYYVGPREQVESRLRDAQRRTLMDSKWQKRVLIVLVKLPVLIYGVYLLRRVPPRPVVPDSA